MNVYKWTRPDKQEPVLVRASEGTPASGFSQPTRRLRGPPRSLLQQIILDCCVIFPREGKTVCPLDCWRTWDCHRRCCYGFFCRGPLPCIHLAFLLGIYLGTELMGHRILECSAWVDTDNHFLKSFWFPLPPAESGNACCSTSLLILGVDALHLAIFVGVLGFTCLFAVLICIFLLTEMMLSRYYQPFGCSLL